MGILEASIQRNADKIVETGQSVQQVHKQLTVDLETCQSRLEGKLFKQDF